jgi:hypothetical protein
MNQPRCLTEPVPVAVAPNDKLFAWVLAIEHGCTVLNREIAECQRLGISPYHHKMMLEGMQDIQMFLSMSYYEYSDWLGMDSPAIERYRQYKRNCEERLDLVRSLADEAKVHEDAAVAAPEGGVA